MAHREYWNMDPSHLEAPELEYELRLRNITQVGNGSDRAKARFLRNLLNEERDGTRERTFDRPSPLQPINDLQLCEIVLKEIEQWADGDTADEHEYRSAWSRILHLVARIKRIKPTSPSGHDQRVELHRRITNVAQRIHGVIQQLNEADISNQSRGGNRIIPRTPASYPRSAVAQNQRQAAPVANSMFEARSSNTSSAQPRPSEESQGMQSQQINMNALFANFSRDGRDVPQSTARSSDASNRVHFRQSNSIIPDGFVRPDTMNEDLDFQIPSSFEIPNESSQNTINVGRDNIFRNGAPPENPSIMVQHGSARNSEHSPNFGRGPIHPNILNARINRGPTRLSHEAEEIYPRRREWNLNHENRPNSNQYGYTRNPYMYLGGNTGERAAENNRPEWLPRPNGEQDRMWHERQRRVNGWLENTHSHQHQRYGAQGWSPFPTPSNEIGSIPTYPVPVHKSVPVNQWRISFSGEMRPDNKTDLNIHDFLEQVEMFSRAENITEQELLRQIVHLLHGRARAWYQNVYRYICTWSDFVSAIKGKFLPLDYHFNLLVEIENRYQRRNEPVGAYINEMELRFRALPEPLHESHKIHIIRKNLLTDYAMNLAHVELRSVRDLEEACKRIESARMMLAARGSRPREREQNRPRRDMAVLEDEPDFYTDEEEIAELQDRQKQRPRSISAPNENRMKRQQQNSSSDKQQNQKAQQSQKKESQGEIKCYKCGQVGHMRKECNESKIYCFKCGKEDVTVNKCPVCNPKNGTTNQKPVAQLDSSNESAQ